MKRYFKSKKKIERPVKRRKTTAKSKTVTFRTQKKRRRFIGKPKPSTARKLAMSFGKSKASSIVKAVKDIAKDQNVSTYRKMLVGDFNPMIYYNAGANTAVPIGKKHWFSHFKKATNNATFTYYGLEFSCFTPYRIIDAMSVLYNGKTAAAAVDTTTGNIAHSTIGHIVYASTTFEMTNLTVRNYDLKVYEMHNVGQAHSTSPLYDAYGSISSHKWVSAPTGNLSAGGGEMYLDDALELSDFRLKKWRIGKVVKLKNFRPGQTYKWSNSIQHKDIKFESLADVANNTMPYGPGTVVYVIEAQTTPILCHTATPAETTYQRPTPTDDSAQSFGFKMKEVWKIAEPENVDDANEGVKTALYSDASLNGIVPTAYVDRFNQKNNYYSYAVNTV